MTYHVIYDGNCNLCVTLVQWLENLDRGTRFQYSPMQDEGTLKLWGITPEDCEKGMILIDVTTPEQRWQGSDAAEQIGRLLPFGNGFVSLYQALPGLKWAGDQIYAQVRDHRYTLFGQRSTLYQSTYPLCTSSTCPDFRPEHNE